MADLLTPDDLAPFATIGENKATEMIADATAMAVLNAPCLAGDDLTDEQLAAAKAILRGAILRWNDSGSGAVSAQTMGPFNATIDTRQPRRSMFWPSEIAELQRICRESDKGGVYAVDTATAAPMLVYPRYWTHGFDDPFIQGLNPNL